MPEGEQGFDEGAAVFVDEQAGRLTRGGVAEFVLDDGPALDAVGEGEGESDAVFGLLLGDGGSVGLAAEGIRSDREPGEVGDLEFAGVVRGADAMAGDHFLDGLGVPLGEFLAFAVAIEDVPVAVAMYLTTNPGGIGHQWFKSRFILPFRRAEESDRSGKLKRRGAEEAAGV